MVTKIIRWLYYILFFVTPLLMYSRTSELFEFNKLLFIYATTSLIVGFWLLQVITQKKRFHHQVICTIALLIFLVSQILSTMFSIDVHTSIFGYYGRFNGGLLSIITYIALFFVFINTFDKSAFKTALKTSLWSSLIVILWGIPAKFGYDLSCWLFTQQLNSTCWTDQFRPAERMFSTLGQPNWLGAYLAINFFIALYFLLKYFVHWDKKIGAPNLFQYLRKIVKLIQEDKNIVPVGALTLYLLLNFSAIIFTRSRSSLGAVIGSLIIYFLFLHIIQRKRLHTIKNLYKILLLLLLIPVILFKTGSQNIDRYLSFSFLHPTTKKVTVATLPPTSENSDVTDSLAIREIVWQGAMKLGLQHPLFGTGVETFAYSYYFVRPLAHNATSEWDFLYNKAHNEYLNYLATTGFIGLGSYLLVIGTVLYIMLRSFMFNSIHQISKEISKEDQEGMIMHRLDNQLLLISLLCAYLAILITNFFGFSTTTINMFFYVIPAFVIILNHPAKKSAEIYSWKESSLLQRVQLAIVGLSVLYCLFYLVNYFMGDLKYTASLSYEQQNDFGQATQLVEQALKQHYEHVYEDKLSSDLASYAFIASYSKEKTIAQSLIKFATYYNQKSLQASPKNVLYWKTKAKNDYLFYETTTNSQYIQDGIQALQKAVTLSPTDPKIPYSIALYDSLLYDDKSNQLDKQTLVNDSLLMINKSLQLKPDFTDGLSLKKQLLQKYDGIQ